MDQRPQILIRVSGSDTPGITAALTNKIGALQAKILDIEQAVTHGQLCLYVLIALGSFEPTALEKTLKQTLKKFAVDIRALPMQGNYTIADPAHRFVVTIIANEIPASLIAETTTEIANINANIDSIRKLNSGGLATIEFIASANAHINLPAIKENLLSIVSNYPDADIAVQKENLYRRSKRLVAFDMDSTLIQGEIIDELAELAGHKAEVTELTQKAMNGEMDFQESLLRRVRLLKGLTKKDLDTVAAKIILNPGADTLIQVLRKLGFRTAIISGGFTYFAEKLRRDLGINYVYANSLELENDTVTGRLQGLIIDARRKSDLLDLLAQQEGVPMDQVIAIGDGANDLQMLTKAGLGIAFNAKPITRSTIGTTLTKKRMESILYLLGITDEDIKAMHS